MAELVADCPRCGAQKITFDVTASNQRTAKHADWDFRFETFAICRHCKKATIFILTLSEYAARGTFIPKGLAPFPGSVNPFFEVDGYISLKDANGVEPPEHLPEEIKAAFREGATCLAVECHNAAGTMFRLCVDLATQDLLPPAEEEGGPNGKQRRDLGLRLQWLFDNKKLPEELHKLAQCIKEDGNDGAHRGTLSKADAEDLLDFTEHLLERRYTMPKRIELAAVRREERKR